MDKIDEYFGQFKAEIMEEYNRRISQGDGDLQRENIFTEMVMNHLRDHSIIFGDPQVCQLYTKIKNANVRLNGFSFLEEDDENGQPQLDLFVCLYNDQMEIPQMLPDREIQVWANSCIKFLTYCHDGTIFSKLDESTDAYALAQKIHEKYESLGTIQIMVLTNGRTKTKSLPPRDFQGKNVKLEVIDIERLYRHICGEALEEVSVDFTEERYGGRSLPCVYVADENCDYDCVLCAIPGEILYRIYEQFNDRLLEANVRSFLSQTGKVNKGIRDTLRDEPSRFMAYNNGIVVTALEAGREQSESGYCITALKGMQIVNGGQTVASIYFTKRKNKNLDLAPIRVTAKILILDPDKKQLENEDLEERFIANVSCYSNTQNAVKTADLSSNMPFHVELEKMANCTYCPDGTTRWFYERGTGKYTTMLAREGTTPAKLKAVKKQRPKSKKITKTDMAKFLFSWAQKPDVVSLGAQKNFIRFMEQIQNLPNQGVDLVTKEFFQELASKAIIFQTVHSVLRTRVPSSLANVTTYTVALFAKQYGSRTDLMKIWREQAVSETLKSQFYTWGLQVYEILYSTANGRQISEWSKKPECWTAVQKLILNLSDTPIPELRH